MVPKLLSSLFTISLISLVTQWMVSANDIFTAISDVEYLLDTQKRIIDDLDVYLDKEEQRLSTLRRTLRPYKLEHETAMEDIPNYLGNPINAFTLIKRLTFDLSTIEASIKLGTEYIKNITMSHPDLKYPTKEDLVGAAQALTRLQETYQLQAHELAEGRLNGVEYSTPMSAGDCYELAQIAYGQEDYPHAISWLTVALRKLREESGNWHFDEADILEYIAYAHYTLGDVRSALSWTRMLLVARPTHARALVNVPVYKKAIADEEAALRATEQQGGDTDEEDLSVTSENAPAPAADYSAAPSAYYENYLSYEKLCRGEMEIPSEVASRLSCRYMSEGHPFLRLAPIKSEQLYIKPDIFMFHEVISDEEIDTIKRLAQPRLRRAGGLANDGVTIQYADFRIAKSYFMRATEHPVLARISQRMSDMTGFDMSTAEDLQVVNYGIGGHYEPHFDFATHREEAFRGYPGNRFATVLFYMSEVAQGGATVFTELGLSVGPVKRAAAYWRNLLPSGEGDLATRHASCPVLRGSKWSECSQMSEVAQGGATVFTELGLSVGPVKCAAAYWCNLLPSGEGDLATRHASCPVLRGSKWSECSQMSEVAQGGATVFTELGLSVGPVKRAAAYWRNLLPSGEGDLATRHASCPVLRGSKWSECSQMSEVAQGGATVFTELGLSVGPVKCAAAYWCNLLPSGEGDLATRHASCPVLRGSKWSECSQMSEVAQGGATVFTELGLSVGPVKCAAAYWRNLLPSGEGNLATRHTSCSVLRGSKWSECSQMSEVAQGGATVFKELGLSVGPVKRTAAYCRNLLPSGEGDLATRHASCPLLRGSKWSECSQMLEVAQGGATVFKELGLSVGPVKRAAAYCRNLLPSGEGDLATRHASCPLLRGSKWSECSQMLEVAQGGATVFTELGLSVGPAERAAAITPSQTTVGTKWLHEGGQELLRPCDTEYQREGFIRQIPKPVPKTSR